MLRTNFLGDPNLGLFGFATERYCITGIHQVAPKLQSELKVPVTTAGAFSTGLLGIFATGNSAGVVVSNFIDQEERAAFEPLNTLFLDSPYTALGNLILMNDNGMILSPLLKKEAVKLSKFFGIPNAIMKLAGTVVVGNAGLATNKGVLLHPHTSSDQIALVEKVLGVPADVGTINFGSPYPGAGIIANSKGCVVSEKSSGPELGRIVEALGFL